MDDFMMDMERIRKEHSVSDRREEYECQECKDSGFIVKTDEYGREIYAHCKCNAIKRTRGLLQQSGIPEEFYDKCFDDFDTRGIKQLENAKERAMRYAKDFMLFRLKRFNSILFSGQVGAGKTHLGMAICNELINKHHIGFVYMSYRNAATEIKQAVLDRENYYVTIGRYMNAGLLYIDDLLKGRSTEADSNILYEIVNYRYINCKPMIVSTEKPIEMLMDFDEGIGSRLLEMCRGNIVTFRGQELNYRLRT